MRNVYITNNAHTQTRELLLVVANARWFNNNSKFNNNHHDKKNNHHKNNNDNSKLASSFRSASHARTLGPWLGQVLKERLRLLGHSCACQGCHEEAWGLLKSRRNRESPQIPGMVPKSCRLIMQAPGFQADLPGSA